MSVLLPKVFLRLGSHAEKDYFEKIGKSADGVIFGANLVESTPGATASLIVKLSNDNMLGSYYLDPMSYAFGEYFDPNAGKLRKDLDWIKSEQKKSGKIVRAWKKSYAGLASKYGGVFQQALDNGTAISPIQLSTDALRMQTADATVKYQLNRLRDEFANDEEYKKFADLIHPPDAVFAPYFYIEPLKADELLTLNIELAKAAARLDIASPVHAILCADASFLADAGLTARVVNELSNSGIKGIWLWFSKFYEEKADTTQLTALVELTKALSHSVDVFNLHGGFFSLCLSRVGMSGISHGVGYGEQKDVIPIIGQSTPTVRYYLPDVHVRLGIPAIEHCFKELGVKTADDFHALVCGCTVCKGVFAGSLKNFEQFGEMHRSTPSSKRMAQTPAAAKRCRFHFLLKRLEERESINGSSIAQLRNAIDAAFKKWGTFETVKESAAHLPRWHDVLGKA